MLIELYDTENEFYQKYMQSFSMRSALSSSQLEGEEQLDTLEASLAIQSHVEAFEYLFSLADNEKLSPYDLPALIEKMTSGQYDNFRKTGIIVEGSKRERTHPRNIPMELYTLFDNYYNIWSFLDNKFLREAKFHIQFLMIHPFGDGNGRCARLLTSFNLCKHNSAPIIITKEKKREYCTLIENRDEEGLASFFEEASRKELEVMLGIHDRCNLDTDAIEKRVYQKQKTKKEG